MIYKLQTGKVLPIIRKIAKPISTAEKLGIPKALRFNPKALEDPYYWGYQQWNSRYNAAVNSGNIQEAQKLRDLHFKTKAPNTKVVDINGNPLHMYHGTDSDGAFTFTNEYIPNKSFTYFMGVNWADENKKLGKLLTPQKKLMLDRKLANGYHTADKSLALGAYAKGNIDKLYDDYLNIENPFEYNEQELKKLIGKDNVADWGYFGGDTRVGVMNAGYDGLFIPQYAHSYAPLRSSTQIKSSLPITYDDYGNIIPIVKRDNFHNIDIRYKQGGKLKWNK